MLCAWARHFTLTVPLFTQVYKWVLANLLLGVTLQWTSIPSRGGGGKKHTLSLYATETVISSGLMGHLAHMQTHPLPKLERTNCKKWSLIKFVLCLVGSTSSNDVMATQFQTAEAFGDNLACIGIPVWHTFHVLSLRMTKPPHSCCFCLLSSYQCFCDKCKCM